MDSFFSDLISTMTGGQAEIQDIQPYNGPDYDYGDYYEPIQTNRNPKTYGEDSEESNGRSKRSLVDVVIRYPAANSVVDMETIKSKLVKDTGGGTNGSTPGITTLLPPGNTSVSTTESPIDKEFLVGLH